MWFFGRLKGLTKNEAGGEINKMMESIKLADKSNAQTRFLSGGMKRKLSLGLALIGKAKVSIYLPARSTGENIAELRALQGFRLSMLETLLYQKRFCCKFHNQAVQTNIRSHKFNEVSRLPGLM